MVALDPEAIDSWARENGLGQLSFAELAAHPQVRALIAGSLEETNRRLPRWETVKRFAMLPRGLTVEAGDLTPSLKLKRRAVTTKHHDLLESLYDDESAAASTPDTSATAQQRSPRFKGRLQAMGRLGRSTAAGTGAPRSPRPRN